MHQGCVLGNLFSGRADRLWLRFSSARCLILSISLYQNYKRSVHGNMLSSCLLKAPIQFSPRFLKAPLCVCAFLPYFPDIFLHSSIQTKMSCLGALNPKYVRRRKKPQVELRSFPKKLPFLHSNFVVEKRLLTCHGRGGRRKKNLLCVNNSFCPSLFSLPPCQPSP